jgi:hypothetical protein
VSAFFCVVLSCVSSGLATADPPSKESYEMSKNRFIKSINQTVNQRRAEGLIGIYLFK